MLPRDTLDRLGKLVPLLASDKPGEVAATAHAIEKTLRAAGSDLHGLASVITGRRAVSRARAANGTGEFNYADAFGEAMPVGGNPGHPQAMTPRFGLRIDGSGYLASWREVATHCLKLNREIHRKHGGRFLRPFEIETLDEFRAGKLWPLNMQVAWIETVLARCHQARDAAARTAR